MITTPTNLTYIQMKPVRRTMKNEKNLFDML